MYKIISCIASDVVNQRLKYLLVRPIAEPANDSELTIFYPEGAVLEPLTLHSISNNKLYVNQLGYASYTSSNLLHSKVGRYCSIAGNVRLMGDSHPTHWATSHVLSYAPRYKNIMLSQGFANWDPISPFRGKSPQVTIGNDVWIGRDATLAREIKIADGAIIAGGAIVTKDVEPYSIVGGIPAKHIRYRFDKRTIERLLNLKWWEHPLSEFSDIKFNEVQKFCDIVESKKAGLKVIDKISFNFSDLLAEDFQPLDKEIWL